MQSIDITVDDLGKEGSGGALSSSKQIEIEVTAANSAPVITVPGLQSIAQGESLTFSPVGTQIFIDDDASYILVFRWFSQSVPVS